MVRIRGIRAASSQQAVAANETLRLHGAGFRYTAATGACTLWHDGMQVAVANTAVYQGQRGRGPALSRMTASAYRYTQAAGSQCWRISGRRGGAGAYTLQSDGWRDQGSCSAITTLEDKGQGADVMARRPAG